MNLVIAAVEEVSKFAWGENSTRNLLHLIPVITWVGGQIIVGAMMPVARRLGPDAPLRIAKQFGRVGWPAFFLAVITGLWNMGSAWGDAENSWRIVLLIKVGLVVLSGITAWRHLKVDTVMKRMFYAMSTLGISVAIVVLGIGLGGN